MEFIRKSQPTAGDVHVNGPLTNVSLAFSQDASGFVADRVFPVVPSDKQSDVYYTYDRGHFWRNQMEKRAEGAESKGVGYSLSTAPFFCEVFGLHHDISDRRRANADGALDLEREATQLLTEQALIRRESDWMSRFFVTGVWTSQTTLSGTSQWSDQANSDPVGNVRVAIRTVLELTGRRPNTLVLGYRSWEALMDHPDIVDRIKFGQTPGAPAIANEVAIAQIFRLDRILISQSVRNTAAEGLANAISFIGADNALVCYTPPSAGLYTPAAGYTFVWSGLMGTAANGMRMTRFRMQPTQSDRIEIEQCYDQKVVSADLGYLILDTVA